MLLAGWEVRIGENCDRGLENAARGRRPRAAFSSPRSQFFPIRTDPKGLFTWRWGTPGRWGTPPTCGKRKLAFTCNIYNPGVLGWGYNLSLIRARSLSSCYLYSLLISFKGFSGSVSLSRPKSSKKLIAKLNIGVFLCTSPTGPAQNPFHLV